MNKIYFESFFSDLLIIKIQKLNGSEENYLLLKWLKKIQETLAISRTSLFLLILLVKCSTWFDTTYLTQMHNSPVTCI